MGPPCAVVLVDEESAPAARSQVRPHMALPTWHPSNLVVRLHTALARIELWWAVIVVAGGCVACLLCCSRCSTAPLVVAGFASSKWLPPACASTCQGRWGAWVSRCVCTPAMQEVPAPPPFSSKGAVHTPPSWRSLLMVPNPILPTPGRAPHQHWYHSPRRRYLRLGLVPAPVRCPPWCWPWGKGLAAAGGAHQQMLKICV